MHFDFDTVIDRRNTHSEKFDTAVQRGYPADVLPLWVADMDFQAPPAVQNALRRALEHGIYGYSFLGEDYYAAVTGWFAKRFGWQTERDWIVTTPGVVFALSAAVRATTKPQDAVLIQPPVYYPFYRVITQNERTLVENPLIYENGTYHIDFADMEAKIKAHHVKLFILCSPHNPVGRVWTPEELKELGRICKQYGVTVVADEIHCDFAFPEYPHTPFVKACPDMAEQTILCTAPSKSFNLAGLQVSNIFIPGTSLRQQFQRQMDICSYHEPNCLGAIACKAAYQEGEEWMDACKGYLRENLAYLRAFLQKFIPRIKLVEPQGTYLAWLDCSGLGLTDEELERLMVQKARLWLDSGSIFSPSAGQFQRIVLACPRATLETAMEQLKAALDK